MTTVYVAMINDRHADPEPVLFSTPEAAIAYASAAARSYARDPHDVDESRTPPSWLYYASYGPEGDSVWVLAKVLDRPEERP